MRFNGRSGARLNISTVIQMRFTEKMKILIQVFMEDYFASENFFQRNISQILHSNYKQMQFLEKVPTFEFEK